MADCKYKIQGLPGEYTEDELKAYLAKGGLAAYEQVKPKLNVSEINRKNADKLVAGIVNGSTTKTKALDYVKSLNLSETTKNNIVDYINQQLKQKKEGTYEGLSETEKDFYNYWEDKFLNNDLSYEQVMYQLGSIADRQPTKELADKYNRIRDIFYAQNAKRAERETKKEEAKEIKTFEDEINSTQLGLSEDELSRYQSVERITRGGIVNFMNDLSLNTENDQVKEKMDLQILAMDMNNLLLKFQVQYGADEYLKKMEEFVNNENNDINARINVSIALNNHLSQLTRDAKTPYDRLKYDSLLRRNSLKSQTLGSKVSLAMNALRVWDRLTDADQVLMGVISPDVQNELDVIRQAVGNEISDEDLIADENGNLNLFEDENKTIEPEKPVKKPGFFERRRMKSEAKDIQIVDKKQLKKDIEEQKKNCK